MKIIGCAGIKYKWQLLLQIIVCAGTKNKLLIKIIGCAGIKFKLPLLSKIIKIQKIPQKDLSLRAFPQHVPTTELVPEGQIGTRYNWLITMIILRKVRDDNDNHEDNDDFDNCEDNDGRYDNDDLEDNDNCNTKDNDGKDIYDNNGNF